MATAIVVLCCALGLAFIPAAIARRDHPAPAPPPASPPAPSSSAGSSGNAGAPPAPAPPYAQSTPPTTAPAASAPTRRAHHRGDGGSTAPAQGTAPTQGTVSAQGTASAPGATSDTNSGSDATTNTSASAQPPATGATTQSSTAATRRPGGRGDAGARNPARRQERIRDREAARAQATAGEPSADGQATAAQPAAEADPISAARKRGGGHRKEGSKETKRAHEGGRGDGRAKKSAGGSGSTGGSTGAGEGGEGAAGGQSTTPTLATTVLAPAPLVSAPAATPAASAASTQATPQLALGPATPAVRRGASRDSRRNSSRGGARLGAAAAAFAGLGLAPAAATTTATPARTPPSARKGAPNSRSSGRTSPLVTTITRFVDVVPTAVRELIAALLALALALAVRSRFSALRARRLERQRVQLLEDVGLLQAALLPVLPARLGPVGTSAAYQPAAGPGAGGDFYDLFALDDGQLAIIVGDVSGHGRQALPHTALVRFTLRAYLEAGLSPRDAVQTAGAVLERQLGGAFATVVVATYNPRERLLCYASAGHPPPVVLPPQADAGSIPVVTICASPPIGVGMRTGTRQTVVSIPGRSQICFHTDGVTEARVGTELFGAERLASTLAELGPSATAPELLERVAERADERPDDMAACLLRVEGGEDAPTVLVEELELDREQATSSRTKRFLLACGVQRDEVAELTRSAGVAAGRAGTVVLEVRHTDGAPEVTLRREHLAYIHARRGADVGVAL
jgi:serine phosphatase RsbU (regulator of sigma subunit)